jgi:hypothetical protein
MTFTGGCFCGAIRFEADGPMRMKGLCYCRSCQKISGGGGNFFIGLEAAGFRYTRGEPALFCHPDHDMAPTRDFCPACGVHLAARSPRADGGVIVKVGVLDDPALFDGPDLVVWTDEKQPFHHLPEGARAFATMPRR